MIVHDDALATLYHGDCVEVMRELPADSVDAIVTDPPYGLEFMGKEWDRLGAGLEEFAASDFGAVDGNSFGQPGGKHVRYGKSAKTMQTWHEAWAREAFRVAKPGSHLLAFGGTRTYHRLASAIEDAGWEIRDCLVWAYASGFPKSLDVSKAIDKANGDTRPVTGSKIVTGLGPDGKLAYAPGTVPLHSGPIPTTSAASAASAAWDGWGTALKPAWEPIVMARKPLRGTVAGNVQEYGTGALNIDATRIPGAWSTWRRSDGSIHPVAGFGDEYVGGTERPADVRQEEHPAGRWPANLLLTDPIFDGDTPGVVGGGENTVGRLEPHHTMNGQHFDPGGRGSEPRHSSQTFGGDSGTYSRFFLVPKSSRSDREPLVRGGLEEREVPNYQPTVLVCECGERWKPPENGGLLRCNHPKAMYHYEAAPRDPGKRANSHPTVKPIELMRHLVRLVTPPGGTVLDCFLGSGTTAIAANAEGFRCIGIEREREYLDIALARMAHQPLGMAL